MQFDILYKNIWNIFLSSISILRNIFLFIVVKIYKEIITFYWTKKYSHNNYN